MLEGIDAACRAGFESVKLDTVLIANENDDELVSLLEFARAKGIELRFIEYMDVGGASGWSRAHVFSRAQVLARIEAAYGPLRPVVGDPHAPAERFATRDGWVFGVIASVTSPFCGTCDRSRLTADGRWYRCLYASAGTDLRGPLRAGTTPGELASLIAEAWATRDDRGAEQRAALLERRRIPFSRKQLLDDVRLEMHTRGG